MSDVYVPPMFRKINKNPFRPNGFKGFNTAQSDKSHEPIKIKNELNTKLYTFDISQKRKEAQNKLKESSKNYSLSKDNNYKKILIEQMLDATKNNTYYQVHAGCEGDFNKAVKKVSEQKQKKHERKYEDRMYSEYCKRDDLIKKYRGKRNIKMGTWRGFV